MKAIEVRTPTGTTMLIEVARMPATVAPPKGGGGGIAGADDVVERTFDQVKKLGQAIAEVCDTVQTEIEATLKNAKPSELALEFSITLAGEAGIPFVTKGTAEGTFQVSVKWDFSQEAANV